MSGIAHDTLRRNDSEGMRHPDVRNLSRQISCFLQDLSTAPAPILQDEELPLVSLLFADAPSVGPSDPCAVNARVSTPGPRHPCVRCCTGTASSALYTPHSQVIPATHADLVALL